MILNKLYICKIEQNINKRIIINFKAAFYKWSQSKYEPISTFPVQTPSIYQPINGKFDLSFVD